jgi:hypothetical protein
VAFHASPIPERGVDCPLHHARPTLTRQRQSARTPHKFGLLPVRSPLLGESSLFLAVLRCFTSRGSLPVARVMGRAPTGLPHSDSLGSLAASASPRHFAAWPRPSSAAIAKASTLRPSSGRLTTSRFLTRSSDQNLSTEATPDRLAPAPGRTHHCHAPAPASPASRSPGSGHVLGKTGLLLYYFCFHAVRVDDPARLSSACIHGRKTQRVSRGALSRCKAGQKNQYSEDDTGAVWVEPRGFEPRTSALQRRRSPN